MNSQQCSSLITVHRTHHRVEFFLASRTMNPYAIPSRLQGMDRIIVARICQTGNDSLHIFPATTRDGAPLRAVQHIEQAMIGTELQERAGGIGGHLLLGARPDRRRHR